MTLRFTVSWLPLVVTAIQNLDMEKLRKLIHCRFGFKMAKGSVEGYSKLAALCEYEQGELASPINFDSSNHSSHYSHRRRVRISALLLAVMIFSSILLGALGLGITQLTLFTDSRRTNLDHSVLVKSCGNSPDAARSRGCHFDISSFCWLPDDCYDKDLSQEFNDIHELKWFLGKNPTRPVSHDQIMTGDYSGLYVNREYHVTHCTAMWKKLHLLNKL
jgi:hypothetical protein